MTLNFFPLIPSEEYKINLIEKLCMILIWTVSKEKKKNE